MCEEMIEIKEKRQKLNIFVKIDLCLKKSLLQCYQLDVYRDLYVNI